MCTHDRLYTRTHTSMHALYNTDAHARTHSHNIRAQTKLSNVELRL